MPFIAACTLAAALLVPLRDGRRGRRATVYGRAAVTASFPAVARDSFDVEAVVTDDVANATAHDVVIALDSSATQPPAQSQEPDLHDVPDAPLGQEARPRPPSHRGLARFFDGRVSAFLATTLRGTIFDPSDRAVPDTGLETGVADDAQRLAEAIVAYHSSREECADDDARRFADAISAYDPSHGDGRCRTGDDGDDARRALGTMSTSREIQAVDDRESRGGSDPRQAASMISTSVEAPNDEGRGLRDGDFEEARRNAGTLSESEKSHNDDDVRPALPSIVVDAPHVRRERQMPDRASEDRASDDDAAAMSHAGDIAQSMSSVEREDRFVRSQRTWSVPPTRMPLRPIVTPEWPQLLPLPFTEASRESRHAVLARRFRAEDGAYEPALCAAFTEEDARGRILALRALGALQGPASLAVLVGALNDGTDDERSAALDSLATRGERSALAGALTDRVDAIAARAALAIVNSGDRGDYERMLGPLVDHARLETLLGLLAAVLP